MKTIHTFKTMDVRFLSALLCKPQHPQFWVFGCQVVQIFEHNVNSLSLVEFYLVIPLKRNTFLDIKAL